MARRNKTRDTGFQNLTCSKCGVTAHSVAGKKHRRCPGQENAPLREKNNRIDGKDRGVWG